MPVTPITHRFIETNGIRMHIAEQGTGPLVILCHGFPEGWYSWRHQMAALAEAGFHAVAPDQRGYGQTDRPEAIEAYDLCHLTGDMVGLVHALNEQTAVIAGHDWGSPVAWTAALLRPDIFQRLVMLSVPFRAYTQGGPKPTDRMRALFGPRQFYQLYFQEPGLAEAELEADVRSTVLKTLWTASGDAPLGKRFPVVFPHGPRFIDTMEVPDKLPAWLAEADVDHWTAEFSRTGYRGALNWYRNIDRNYELLAFLDKAAVRQPTLFVAGEEDVVITMYRDSFNHLEATVPGLRGKHLLPGAGHWIQQERPAEVNRLLLEFLRGD